MQHRTGLYSHLKPNLFRHSLVNSKRCSQTSLWNRRRFLLTAGLATVGDGIGTAFIPYKPTPKEVDVWSRSSMKPVRKGMIYLGDEFKWLASGPMADISFGVSRNRLTVGVSDWSF